MESNQELTASFALSLIGGIIVIIVGIVGLAWFGANGSGWGGFGGWMSGMMQGYHGFNGGGQFGFFSVISIMGLFSGVVMIVGAVLLRSHPKDHVVWGVLILVFALASLADMGGYFIGAILGIVGGALALSYHPRTPVQTPQTQSYQ